MALTHKDFSISYKGALDSLYNSRINHITRGLFMMVYTYEGGDLTIRCSTSSIKDLCLIRDWGLL